MKKTPVKSSFLSNLMRCLDQAINSSDNQLEDNHTPSKHSSQRRKFLTQTSKLAIGVGIATTLDGCRKAVETFAPKNLDINSAANSVKIAPRIAIIGGGIAGLHAAFILKQKGFSSTVYEASSRIGGRIFTSRDLVGNGLHTELGGEFIDSIHKDMLTLAKTFNLELIDTKLPNTSSLKSQTYFFNGIHYTEQQVIDAFIPYAQKIKADQMTMSALITADSHSSADSALDNMNIAQYFDKIGLNGWLRSMLDVAYVTEFGQPINQQTALNFLWMVSPKVTDGSFEVFGLSDERYKIKGGNDLIISNLAAQLKGQITTGYELIEIKETINGSQELSFKADKSIKRITVDYVLLTIPFTILKSIKTTPSWPTWKKNAIEQLGYGNNSKLMVGFKNKFWNKSGFQGYYFTDSKLQSGWDNSEGQAPVEGGLTLYSGGQQSIDVGSGTAAGQLSTHLPLLEKMYPGATENLNGKVERFVWPTYKWTLCSYTCFKPGQYTSIAGYEMKPIGNIFFAGEHCSYDFQGYMNGGAETGRRAADAMADKIKFG